MKVVVNRGTVHVATKPGAVPTDKSTGSRPEVKKFAPGAIVDLPNDEAERFIAQGHVTKYVPPKEQGSSDAK